MTSARSRALSRAVIATIILTLTLPLIATADECVTGTVEWVELDDGYQSPLWHSDVSVPGIRTAIEGHFLLVHYGPDAPDTKTMEGVVSVDLNPAVTSAVVCPDGTVTLSRNSLQEGEPSSAVVDLVAMWADWIDLTPRLRFGAF